ncbi:tastin [Rhynchocyon petersi]
MTTVQAKDPRFRGVSPTPSKIPLRAQRLLPFPTCKPCTLDQENQVPRRLLQKPAVSIQLPLAGPAVPRSKATDQPEKSAGSTQQRNPLEELRASPGRHNVGPGPPPRTEAPGATDFVADPAALATILSGEGVKSCRLGRPPSLAQRVLIRESQRSALQRGQGARASAYLASRTPKHQLDPARASCFSRIEGPGPRGRTLCSQRLETLIPPSATSFPSSTHRSFLELRRMTGGSSRMTVSQASGPPVETSVQPASSLPEGKHEAVTHSHEGGGGPLSMAQRIPLREIHARDSRDSRSAGAQPMPGRVVLPTVTHLSPFGSAQRVASSHPPAPPSYSVLRHLRIHPKTQFTPIPSAPRTQQGQWVSDLSPQSCPEPEELFLPWENIAVQLFGQESSRSLQEEPTKPSEAPPGLPPDKTPNLQELKMQRISILQQLLRQEVEGLLGDKRIPIKGSSLEMIGLHPLLTETSRTRNAPEHNSGTSHPPQLFQHSELPESCLPEECGEPQLCPPAEAGVLGSCPVRQSVIPNPSPQQQPGVSGPSIPAEAGPIEHSPLEKTELSEPHPNVEPKTPEASPTELRSPKSIQESHNSPCAPVPTSPILSSQHVLCASPSIHSLQPLRPPPGPSGPSSLVPRTLALRQRLKACVTAIHCFHEACLDDECAFYTSRAPPSAPLRVCTNPVAKLLEWQDALCFIPVSSAATEGCPS